jgi:hypothetical protein
MGWQFAGFFARAEPSVLAAALHAWPGVLGQTITEPFRGIGVAASSRALIYGDIEEEHDAALELAWTLDRELVAWSRSYPTTPFVFIRADCFGGNCWYEGYVCANGAIRFTAKDTSLHAWQARSNGDDTLPQLIQPLCVELTDTLYLVPFTRGFFESPH